VAVIIIPIAENYIPSIAQKRRRLSDMSKVFQDEGSELQFGGRRANSTSIYNAVFQAVMLV
jgi:hypothetical protein